LDLSAIVPAGAKAVKLAVRIQNPISHMFLTFRRKGSGAIRGSSKLITQVANIRFGADVVVGVDENRIIEYLSTPAAWTLADIAVTGWWL